MTSEACPRFSTCNATVCPLSRDWPSVDHFRGEPVCKYLLDSGKVGAAERYADDPVFPIIVTRLPAVCGRHPDIAYRVKVASRTGFMGDNLRRESTQQAIQTCIDARVSGQNGIPSPPAQQTH